MAGVNVRPLGDRVLVQPIEETEVKKGGIIIPDTAKEKPQEGKVVALGTGKMPVGRVRQGCLTSDQTINKLN